MGISGQKTYNEIIIQTTPHGSRDGKNFPIAIVALVMLVPGLPWKSLCILCDGFVKQVNGGSFPQSLWVKLYDSV